jgi:hypothetical protein
MLTLKRQPHASAKLVLLSGEPPGLLGAVLSADVVLPTTGGDVQRVWRILLYAVFLLR